MAVTIQQVSIGSPEYQGVYDLREAMLRKPIGLSLANEDLSGDKEDIILSASENGNIIGCLMLKPVYAHTIKFRQMAVTENYQGKGIGNMLITAAEEICRQKGYNKVILHARETAEGFYARLGYLKTSELFTEVGIPHYVMEKQL